MYLCLLYKPKVLVRASRNFLYVTLKTRGNRIHEISKNHTHPPFPTPKKYFRYISPKFCIIHIRRGGTVAGGKGLVGGIMIKTKVPATLGTSASSQ